MAESRFKNRQTIRANAENERLMQAKGAVETGPETKDTVSATVSSKPMKKDLAPIQFYVEKDVKNKLKSYCSLKGLNMSSVLVEMVKVYMEDKGIS